ncbi:3-oxoacyl-ACP reductase [Thermoleophilia bacterium SCSIO 60948]|nr:3-oxoacyl-ACP reductase [Thermoleophilia bacterium SCSIO 60948]
MSDRYQTLTNSPVGKAVSGRIGLPVPPILERHEPGKPVVSAPVMLLGTREGRLSEPTQEVLRSIGAHVETDPSAAETDGAKFAAVVFDASGIDDVAKLRSLYEAFHPTIRRIARSGRLLVLAGVPEEAESVEEQIAQRAIEGFTRTAAKEIGNSGSTAQLVRVERGAEGALESTLRFLLSARSAFVDGQVVTVRAEGADKVVPPADWDAPHAGRVALVTGAARGIGASIAETLARDGAEVICVDVPQAGEALTAKANEIGGTAMQLDITSEKAAERIVEHVRSHGGQLDVLVHNAGITRDKTIGRMSEEQWDSVIAVNLQSQVAITEALLEANLIGQNSRVITVSSTSGIAGNRGQANYATTKAGVIGLVDALAPEMAKRGATINAVAPGFIETAMTAAMPVGTREGGRRISSLTQGGQPVDVAETIGWFASPASSAVNGNVVRVCGQNMIGA